MADASLASTQDLPKRVPPGEDLLVPVAEGDLREAFDLPLVGGREAERGEIASGPATADAAGLFQDAGPTRRRPAAAEARGTARRCVHCGGVVPLGMSICASCGTDQESGMRVGLEDDFAPPPPRPAEGPPLHVALIGGLCSVGGLILLILAAIQSVRGESSLVRGGWLCLAAVSGFGIFACIDFIRGRSIKLFMLALSLGALVDLATLIGLPLFHIYFEAPEHFVSKPVSDDPDAALITLKPPEQRLDQRKITMGVTLLIVYAFISIYLLSPLAKRHINLRAYRESTAF